MLQFWQSLCLMLVIMVALLIYEKGIRPVEVTAASSGETIEQMLMKEVL